MHRGFLTQQTYIFTNKKELQEETGAYDYGARFYDPVIARWTSVDNKAQLLEMVSPYIYSLNNPTNFIDIAGELPIFINGRTSSDSERGSQSYWDAQLLRTIASSGIPNPGGEIQWVDGNRGAGRINGHDVLSKDNAFGVSDRRIGGKLAAKEDFKEILSKLEKDPKTGKIIEKIQIYTHSRGGAFGEGYTDELLDLIKENADKFQDANHEIDYVLNLAPHQSNWIDGPEGVDNYSIDHVSDMLSGNDMSNTTAFTTNTGGYIDPGSHKNSTFTKEVGAFLKAWKSNKGDNKKLISNFLDAMKKLGIKASVSENP